MPTPKLPKKAPLNAAKKKEARATTQKTTRQSDPKTPPGATPARNSSTPSPMKVPDDVISNVAKCGDCRVVRHVVDGFPYAEVTFLMGSAGHKALIEWSERRVVDPLVTIIEDPALRPPAFAAAAAAAVCAEARSIAMHCAPLTAANCATGVAVAGPVLMPAASVNIHHAKVALTFLLTTLQNPPAALYPAISAIPVGSYVCSVQYAYKNSQQLVHVHR